MTSDKRRARQVYAHADGLPAMTAVPTGAPTREGGVLFVLALVPEPQVPRAEIEEFVGRFGFVTRDEVARAQDSQTRWSLERDGSVSVTFLADSGVSQLVLPPDAAVQQWAAMARGSGGTVSVMVLPDLELAGLEHIGRRLGQSGGEYWHLSVGCVVA